MPVPSKGGTEPSLEDLYQQYTTATRNIVNWSRDWPAMIRNGELSFARAAQWCEFIKQQRAAVVFAVTSGGVDLESYAAAQARDTGLDLSVEHATFLTALDAVLAWLVVNVPTGISHVDSIAADGTVNYTLATPVQGEPLAVLLETLNATIDP